MLHFIRFTRRSGSAGFSLVEVALAVAIASLGIITCLGLLPEGIEMSRKTGLLAINSNVLDQIIRDVENARNWKALKASYSAHPGFPSGGAPAGAGDQRKFYDYQGTAVTASSPNIAFVAQIEYNLPCYLPGDTTDQRYLARLRISIANTSNPQFSFPVPANGLYTSFYHLVSKSS
ncbi:MAG: Verru_Chthon cassette protein B [Verrucomicrobiaceae bacterium]|nr:Verru_Chthon cassette protein B [Verrucomicrobiaceae bacterium]